MKYDLRNLSFYTIIFLFLFYLNGYSKALAEELSIIVNKENPINVISSRDIKAYFLKEKVFWKSGEGVVPLDFSTGSSERLLFLKKIINKTEVEIEEYWILRKQTEAQYAPQQISSSKMMIKLVGSLKWAIGYVSSKYLDSEALKKIKVVEVVK